MANKYTIYREQWKRTMIELYQQIGIKQIKKSKKIGEKN